MQAPKSCKIHELKNNYHIKFRVCTFRAYLTAAQIARETVRLIGPPRISASIVGVVQPLVAQENVYTREPGFYLKQKTR